jgi:hypothetical protein
LIGLQQRKSDRVKVGGQRMAIMSAAGKFESFEKLHNFTGFLIFRCIIRRETVENYRQILHRNFNKINFYIPKSRWTEVKRALFISFYIKAELQFEPRH